MQSLEPAYTSFVLFFEKSKLLAYTLLLAAYLLPNPVLSGDLASKDAPASMSDDSPESCLLSRFLLPPTRKLLAKAGKFDHGTAC